MHRPPDRVASDPERRPIAAKPKPWRASLAPGLLPLHQLDKRFHKLLNIARGFDRNEVAVDDQLRCTVPVEDHLPTHILHIGNQLVRAGDLATLELFWDSEEQPQAMTNGRDL